MEALSLDIGTDDEESTEVRKEILQFAWALEKRLRAYESKLGSKCWKDDDPWKLFHRLIQEASGISDALITHKHTPQKRTVFLEKAAATSLYTLLIADLMHGLLESTPPTKK